MRPRAPLPFRLGDADVEIESPVGGYAIHIGGAIEFPIDGLGDFRFFDDVGVLERPVIRACVVDGLVGPGGAEREEEEENYSGYGSAPPLESQTVVQTTVR